MGRRMAAIIGRDNVGAGMAVEPLPRFIRPTTLPAGQALLGAPARKGGKQHEMPAHHLLKAILATMRQRESRRVGEAIGLPCNTSTAIASDGAVRAPRPPSAAKSVAL